ncbi:phage tail protein [Enterococcus faecalis]|uniref:phage tail protein n=1 Tax=Enterococcus faecalis TaxID=1351 RepID=UPI0037283FA1|nr:phage tail protein [Enterococcus faecalis]
MAREYIVYKGEEVIVPASPSPLEITGIEPNTDVPAGTYQVGFADGGEKVNVPAFKTSPIVVTGLEFSPKTSTADAGTAGSRQITATVLPENATNKKVNYSITPVTEGLAVSGTGNITWTETVPAGTYVTEGETEDGKKTAQHTLTLNNQA